jgi:flagellar hook-associated protein 1
MTTLSGALGVAGEALNAYQEALGVVQNNITNANTPGFATQSPNLVAQPFDSASGLAGGVAEQGLISARDSYADEQVQQQLSLLGQYKMQAQATSSLSNYFDASGNTGVEADWNNLIQSFQSWSVSPDSSTAEQSLLADAGTFASDLSSLANSLTQTGQQIQSQVGSTVQQINQITSQIQQYNVQEEQSTSPDPNLDANMEAALEQLAQYVNFSSIKQPDGTVTVVLSGGSPLVVGTTQYALSASTSVPSGAANPDAPPDSQILDSQGNDITSQITGGNLGGLLDVANNVLPSLLGDSNQVGSLNTFAQSVADTINGILESGTVSPAAGSAAGVALFTYNNSNPTDAAASLAVNPNLTASQLAPVDANGNANGNALALASLGSSTANGGIGGQTFTDYFAGIVSNLGAINSAATNDQTDQQQVVDQAQTLQGQISGVSLDQQATQMLQFQNSYQAAAQMVNALNTIAEATINMMVVTT